MKKKLLLLFILTLALISFKARAATYNFNFYNNDKEETVTASPLGPVIQAAPAPTTDPLIAPLAQTSAQEVQHVAGSKEWFYSFGAGYYIKSSSNNFTLKQSQSNRYNLKVAHSKGVNLSFSLGRPGGFKMVADVVKENQNLLFGSMNREYKRTINAYGVGLNLRKEFLYKSVVGFEMGVGAQYLQGKNSDDSQYNDYHKTGEVKANTISASTQLGLNFHFEEIIIGLQAFYNQNKIKVDSNFNTIDKTLTYATTGGQVGLAYKF